MAKKSGVSRAMLRYHGGKFRTAPWIISHFPPHRIYVEGFGGGGSVLMQKKPSYVEVYNDVWNTVVNVFKVLRNRDQANELIRLIELTPFARTEFYETSEEFISDITDPVELARRTILRSMAGFGSAAINPKFTSGFRSNANNSRTPPAGDWATYPMHIQSFIDRLKGVCIESKDYRDVSTQQDSLRTLHYLDPPYVTSTRTRSHGNSGYEFEFSDSDHVELCEFSRKLVGMTIISGYDNEIYRDILTDWSVVKKDVMIDKGLKRTECLFLSPNTIKANNIYSPFQ